VLHDLIEQTEEDGNERGFLHYGGGNCRSFVLFENCETRSEKLDLHGEVMLAFGGRFQSVPVAQDFAARVQLEAILFQKPKPGNAIFPAVHSHPILTETSSSWNAPETLSRANGRSRGWLQKQDFYGRCKKAKYQRHSHFS
jgi:hypothetical protein